MKPIDFPESSANFATDQPQYITLPAHVQKNDETGCVTTCWELSVPDLIEIQRTGKIWLQVLTFKKQLQPIKVMTKKPELRD